MYGLSSAPIAGRLRPSRLPPQLVSDASQRLFINVEKQPVALPPVRVPEKGKRLAPRIEDARLLRMQRQTETAQHVLQPGQLSVRTTRRQEDEIVRIANESSSQVAPSYARAEGPVEQVQEDVRQQRRDDSALRR